MVLDNDKLHIYEEVAAGGKRKLKKSLNVADFDTACFHYDKDAPKVSKRADIEEKDESRFDVYVKKPVPREYRFTHPE